jgi:hypothetical protein
MRDRRKWPLPQAYTGMRDATFMFHGLAWEAEKFMQFVAGVKIADDSADDDSADHVRHRRRAARIDA